MGTSKLSGKSDEMLGATCDEIASHPGGVAILLFASCHGNCISSGSYARQARDLNLSFTTRTTLSQVLLFLVWI